jgi:hypothetical protein
VRPDSSVADAVVEVRLREDVRRLSAGSNVLLGAFIALTAAATILLFVLSPDTDRFWAWTIQPPLTAAFLGAGYCAGLILVALALRDGVWTHARIPMITVLVFATLTLVATLLHLDRFHFHVHSQMPRLAAWVWLVVYLVVPVALAVAVLRQSRTSGVDAPPRQPMPTWLRALLVVQAVIMLPVGVVLFAHPSAAMSVWPWALTPLTARMVAAWLIAFGLAAFLAFWERDLRRLEIDSIGYIVFGVLQLVALIRFGDQVRWGTSAAIAYVIVLPTIPLAGAAGWFMSARGRRSEYPATTIAQRRHRVDDGAGHEAGGSGD